jgi:hypothetical protein
MVFTVKGRTLLCDSKFVLASATGLDVLGIIEQMMTKARSPKVVVDKSMFWMRWSWPKNASKSKMQRTRRRQREEVNTTLACVHRTEE